MGVNVGRSVERWPARMAEAMAFGAFFSVRVLLVVAVSDNGATVWSTRFRLGWLDCGSDAELIVI